MAELSLFSFNGGMHECLQKKKPHGKIKAQDQPYLTLHHKKYSINQQDYPRGGNA